MNIMMFVVVLDINKHYWISKGKRHLAQKKKIMLIGIETLNLL